MITKFGMRTARGGFTPLFTVPPGVYALGGSSPWTHVPRSIDMNSKHKSNGDLYANAFNVVSDEVLPGTAPLWYPAESYWAMHALHLTEVITSNLSFETNEHQSIWSGNPQTLRRCITTSLGFLLPCGSVLCTVPLQTCSWVRCMVGVLLPSELPPPPGAAKHCDQPLAEVKPPTHPLCGTLCQAVHQLSIWRGCTPHSFTRPAGRLRLLSLRITPEHYPL